MHRLQSAFAAVLVGLLCTLLFSLTAAAEKRIALVIGNSSYEHVARLPNPINDAAALAQLLTAAGFAVDLRRDVGLAEFRQALGQLSELTREADQVAVFFAGHGIEVDGENYLIPVDAKLERDFDVEDEAISLARVLRAIEPARRLRLVMLDACRENPFARTMKRTMASRSIGRGLARVEVSISDTLIAFATEAGTIAADGDGINSPFTAALLRHLPTPGLDLRLAFGRVRDAVMAETGNRQTPFLYGSLGGTTVALVEEPSQTLQPSPPQPQPADPCALAEAHWKSTEAIGTLAAFQDHLARFANCAFAGLAQARMAALQQPARVVPEQPPVESFHYVSGLDPQGDNWLALRSHPSVQRGALLMKMPPDTLLTIVDREGTWLRVRLRTGETGWAHAGYIACCKESRGTLDLVPSPVTVESYHYIVGLDPLGDNWLALRSEPSTKRGARLMKMGPDTLLEVLGREGTWLLVRLRTGEVGWAHAKYIACCKELPR